MRIIGILLLFLFFIPLVGNAVTHSEEIKAAFIRDGDLWISQTGKEVKVTKSGNTYNPSWSPDGKWLLFQHDVDSPNPPYGKWSEIWVYEVEKKQLKKIFYNGSNPKWAPNENIIAFKNENILNVCNLKHFFNVALGVDDYNWLPDGSGFILSSSAQLRPNGWTQPKLYKKLLDQNWEEINPYSGAEVLFTIPKEVQKNGEAIQSIQASSFQFSPSQKWVSFIISPTASISMDANMLSVITAEGEQFQPIDEVIFGVGSPKWAPMKEILAYISGTGRIVFGFKNKDLKLKELPTSVPITPENFAELDFTWVDDQNLITSRVIEADWSNDIAKQPLPSLYKINWVTGQQQKMIDTPKNYGDYQPQFIASAQALIWLRKRSLQDESGDIWISNLSGENKKKWIENVNEIAVYSSKRP
ncbi:PD40 domain-containing protein [Bacillus carboniphilus]|uniref:PD40 domain-containing protein n=1 Tax=Bacillus carboniphilus TaxID=86663 RepID=A0ABN0W2Z5_9BACI